MCFAGAGPEEAMDWAFAIVKGLIESSGASESSESLLLGMLEGQGVGTLIVDG